MMHRCAIIGVLDDGCDSLSRDALQRLREADVIIGAARPLALFEAEFKPGSLRHDLGGQLSQVPEWLRQAQADGLRCAVLATGDPLCHGIAAYLMSRLCIDAFDILPNVSTLQLACARVGLPWQEMKICSVHTRDAGEWQEGAGPEHGLYALRQALQQHERLGVLTSPANSPNRIARLLQAAGLAEQFQMAVVECLLQPEERVIGELSVDVLASQTFADPNVVLLWRVQPAPRSVLFGLADDSFQQRQPEKGLITKREARAVSLARMQLRRDSVVWDIGAGSGSVGLEAAQLCPAGHVYAIEKNPGDAENAAANRARLGLANYTLRCSKAPEGLEHWPDPDAVFIGGSGGELAGLIELVLSRLRPAGWLVMNFVTVENLATAVEALKRLGADWDLTQLAAARSKPILDMHRLAAENPVWILSARRGQELPS